MLICVILLSKASAVSSMDGVIGSVPAVLTAMNDPDARIAETKLGNVSADAARLSTGADIAILNGGDFAANLQAGETTMAEVFAVFTEDRELAMAEVTPRQLREILENGISRITIDERERIDRSLSAWDGFPQISGFEFKYDATLPAGRRVMSITLSTGEELELSDNETKIRLTATEFMLGGGYGMPQIEHASATGTTLAGALADYVSAGFPEPKAPERITVAGTTENAIISRFPTGLSFAVILLFALANGARYRRSFNFER
jgi:5'-nucleotidase/UDP-sugar diphosphatase